MTIAVISNSSPIIALSRVDHLSVLKALFGRVCIPESVFEETVINSNSTRQKNNILAAIQDFIEVRAPKADHKFSRNLGKGERGVLNLALDNRPDVLIIDDKKARNEAMELGFMPSFTTDILREAATRGLLPSFQETMRTLHGIGIHLPG